MVFCAACGIAAVSCYGEQSNSSDIVTDQTENNNQQMHHSSNTGPGQPPRGDSVYKYRKIKRETEKSCTVAIS